MAEKIIDFNPNSNQKLHLVLAIDPNTGTPIWASELDGFLLSIIVRSFYDYAKDHPITILGSDLANKNDFTFTQSIDNFKTSIFPNENAYLYRNLILHLHDDKELKDLASGPMIITLFGQGSSDSYISAILDKNNVRIDAKL